MLKSVLLQQSSDGIAQKEGNKPSEELRQAKEETSQVQESLKVCLDFTKLIQVLKPELTPNLMLVWLSSRGH